MGDDLDTQGDAPALFMIALMITLIGIVLYNTLSLRGTYIPDKIPCNHEKILTK